MNKGTIEALKKLGQSINRLAKFVHTDADEHGLWDDFREAMTQYKDASDLKRLCTMRYYATSVVAGEVSEMRSASDNRDAYEEEMADVLIALLSTAEELHVNLGNAVVRKIVINHDRPWKHGKETKVD